MILRAKNIVKSFSGVMAVKADELGFERGEITALVGPNGAGKSTLLKILALLDYPDQGAVFLNEKPIQGHGSWFKARKKITMVDQKPFAFNGSVNQNAAYGLKLRGLSATEIQKRVDGALCLFGLEGFQKRRARTLSGGEIQRLAIARAVVLEPDVLILDEPTAHVDEGKVRRVEEVIRDLSREKGTAVIIATHDQDQAVRLASRTIRMERGTLLDCGSRVLAGKLTRRDGGLYLEVEGNWTGPDKTSICSLKLGDGEIIVTMGSECPQTRVTIPNVREVGPAPGEEVTVESLGRTAAEPEVEEDVR